MPGNVWDKEYICPTLTTMAGGNREPMIVESYILTPKRTEYGKAIRKAYEAGNINEKRSNMTELGPRMDNNTNTLTTVQKDNLLLESICINDRGFSEKAPQITYDNAPVIKAETHGNLPKVIENSQFIYRIRKLTPIECWRLMGLTKEDCDKAAEVGVSNTQLYKQAGNGIITNCCELLAEHLYKAQYDNSYICTDEKMASKSV